MGDTSNNPDVSSKAGFITNNEELRIVMVGKTGSGKSASGNTILGQEAFESEFCAQSITVDCKKKRGLVGGQKVAVIDTPGLFDTRYDMEKTAKDLSQCMTFAAPGPHVFLVVIRLGRFTEEEKKSVEMIQQVFGQAADRYSMVLFTMGDDLEGTIQDYLKTSSDLQELVARCNYQYHVFNNENKNDCSQVDELLQKIRNIVMKNGGSHYTSDMFQRAEKATEEEKELILMEQKEEICREQAKIEKKLQENYRKQLKKMQDEFQAQREEERRRDNEERDKEMHELKQQKEREWKEEKKKIQAEYEAKARALAEESNPFLHIHEVIGEAAVASGGILPLSCFW